MNNKARHPGGRPPLATGDPSTPVCVKLPSTDYDRACAAAQRRRTSVPALARKALSKMLDEDDEEDD